MASFACPQCKQLLLIADTALGRNIKCPKCATIFIAQAPVPPAMPAAPAVAPPKSPANAVPPAPKPADDLLDFTSSKTPRVSKDRPSNGDSVKFTVVVKTDPDKRLKGRFQGSLTAEGLRMQQGTKKTVIIPRNTSAEYMGGNCLSVDLDGRSVRLQVTKMMSYQNRLAEDLVSYLNDGGPSLSARGYSLPWYFVALVLLPLGIPILTLGGVLPCVLGFGLCAINTAIVQREKWPPLVRALVAGGVALLGYLVIGALVLGAALLNYYRANQTDTKNSSQSAQQSPPADPADNPPARARQPKPPVAAAPDDLKPGPAILPFYTAAIDLKAKEALILEQQKLTRCGYPDFKQGDTYSLGNFSAFASALDSTRGMLYLAVTEPQALVGTNPYQRILGQGDIHVHDIRALREGKVEPGAVLKPTAIIRLRKKIGRLLLSPNGLSLYYLDVTDDKSPKLGWIDTRTRQPGGATALLEKTEEICLSPDGKTLYAAGQPAPGKGAVQVIDAAELKVVKEVPLPGSPYWLDATDQGLVFVSLHRGPGQWTEVVAVDVKTGEVTMRWGGMFGLCSIRLSPDRKRLYVAVVDLSPNMLQAWKLPEKPGEKPQKAGEGWNEATHDFLITPDGRFLFTRAGKSFRLAGGS